VLKFLLASPLLNLIQEKVIANNLSVWENK
jgi:hypothetical protein